MDGFATRLDGFVIRPSVHKKYFAWTDLQSVHKEIEKICYRISNANIQRVQSVRIANPNEQVFISSQALTEITILAKMN